MNQELTANGNPVTHLYITSFDYQTNQKVSLLRELDWGMAEIEFLNGNKERCESKFLLEIIPITDQ